MLVTEPTEPTSRYREKRESILAAAAAQFNAQGVKGATLAGIAGSVGLVTNSVTYYYRKKEDLARACFLRAIAAYEAVVLAAGSAPSVSDRIRAFLDHATDLFVAIEAGRHPMLVTFADIRALPETQSGEVFDAYTAMFRRVRALLRGPETEHLGREELNARAHLLLSVVNWMRGWLPQYEADDCPRAARRLADILLAGLAAPPSRWTGAEPPWDLGQGADTPSEAFLRAATVLVNEQGYRGASVDKISARLNVTKGSFYHHNDNKHDLISECFHRTHAVMREALVRAEGAPGRGWERACAATLALVRYQVCPQGPLLRSSATSALPDQAHREEVLLTMRRLAGRMQAVVVDGMMDGSVRPLDPSIAAQALIAAINAAAELHRWVRSATPANVGDLVARPMLEGLLCPGAQR